MKPQILVVGNSHPRKFLTEKLLYLHNAGIIEVVYDNGVVSASCSKWYAEWCLDELVCVDLKAIAQQNPQQSFLAAMKDKQNKLDSKKRIK